MPWRAVLVMSTNKGSSARPGQARLKRVHMRQWGSVASHFMRFLRHVAQDFVRGGISFTFVGQRTRVLGKWWWDGEWSGRWDGGLSGGLALAEVSCLGMVAPLRVCFVSGLVTSSYLHNLSVSTPTSLCSVQLCCPAVRRTFVNVTSLLLWVTE
jgi:hypothetical protein